MYLDEKRQAISIPSSLPPIIPAPTAVPGVGLFVTTTITSTLPRIETITGNGIAPSFSTAETVSVMTIAIPAQEFFTTAASQSTTTFASSTPYSAPSQVQTVSPAQPSSPSARGIPLKLIPAIVIPIVLVALVSPVILYFCLTRHDRKRRNSRTSSGVNSGHSPELRTEAKRQPFGHSLSKTPASNPSGVMNFSLGPAVEKSLPMFNIIQAPEDIFARPGNWEVHRCSATPIGRAITSYSFPPDTSGDAVDASPTRTSIRELSEENMRIATLANDSNASFRVPELDQVSAISASEDSTPCPGPTGDGVEYSDVSSIYTNENADRIDDGVGILGNHEARRSGLLR